MYILFKRKIRLCFSLKHSLFKLFCYINGLIDFLRRISHLAAIVSLYSGLISGIIFRKENVCIYSMECLNRLRAYTVYHGNVCDTTTYLLHRKYFALKNSKTDVQFI